VGYRAVSLARNRCRRDLAMTQNDTLDLNDVRRLIEEAEASLLMGGDLDELGEALATLERLGPRVREKAKTARLER